MEEYSNNMRMGNTSDIDLAVVSAQVAVSMTLKTDPRCAASLNNLGSKLGRRYQRTGAMSDLEEAISVARQVATATPNDHPGRAIHLNNLGIKLESRYKRTAAINDLHEASAHLYEAWNTCTAIPFVRIRSAARCIKLLAPQDKLDAAAQLGKAVIRMLPSVNTKLLDRTDQQYIISTFAGVAADLCALRLTMNQVEDALLYLEQGRAVILSQLIDNRSDVSDLAKNHPKIACRYEELRNDVNTPIRSLEQDAAREQALNACIDEIRTIQGHERFLLSQTTAEMQECAAGGTIVVVNITEYRSDAILILPTIIDAINLPDLLASDVETWLDKDWTYQRPERAVKNRDYSRYLAWLWKSCVKQVLDRLHGLHTSAGCDPFRVWWVGSGLASTMPFHAAGIHDISTTETAYHKAVSSYTPSIKALARARKQDKDLKRTTGSLLVVTMPTTPPEGEKALANLFGVNEERNHS
ncbi:hypothetical protein Forpi1262_v014530 [Fusarium oxysporum f. sp. raphani]|uniref:CHAT domain-containing protein n=1 Tax=Fusarium oxysporum f. sp. raphani TaxID=96318 RepID=A0A8J5PI13_FUSOX|nr:hypothetical protein Forpi1262_v014530 [Fusarium oxysporum f. sp. raphani]